MVGLAGNRFDFVLDFLRNFHRAGQFVQHFAGLVFDGAQHAAHIAHHVAGQVFGESANIGRNRHFVVVQNHQQVNIHIAGVVQRFKSLAGGHRAVADDGHAAVRFARQFIRHRHAERGADGGGRMADAEIVVLAFAALGETGQTTILAHGTHAGAAAGEDFMRIALVADIPHQMVVRRVIHIMQRHR